VFLKAYDTVAEARRGIGGWLLFYNDARPHQALGYRTPREVFEAAACVDVDNDFALSTSTQARKQEESLLTEIQGEIY
jgi:putative transposase